EKVVYTSLVAARGLCEDGWPADETVVTGLDDAVGVCWKAKPRAEPIALEDARGLPVMIEILVS
ncbi:NAD-dependent dehydratase, partial [Candidatus Bipolaricaulota bacterium]|nr:NAD-dependent dehydratase [Candidatus Bipolaricaulota bacterium]